MTALALPEVSIETQTFTRFTARIQGLTPLLMHSPRGMQAADSTPQKKNAKKIPTPAEEAELGTWRDEDGNLALKAEAVMEAIREGGKQFADPQNKRATLYRRLSAGIFPSETDWFQLLDNAGDPIVDYEIDVRRAVLASGASRVAVMRARPIFREWASIVSVLFDPEMLETEHLVLSINEAGKRVGLGDYRPSAPKKPGPYGRFRVMGIDVEEVTL